ncbi:tRNA preQ1(34) S-adenosylmethionine ribosyltransferase-isomerase QueA [candidate division KSB1 bacterium]
MKLSDYDYDLPVELVAQHPLERRSDSRLLVVNRGRSPQDRPKIEHRLFRDLLALLSAGDLLVLNRTKVFKARLAGTLSTGREAELLLVRRIEPGRWEAMVRPGKKLKPGVVVSLADGRLSARIEPCPVPGRRVVVLVSSDGSDPDKLAAEVGSVPLPPYIKREPESKDEGRYQTVYAREVGAVAAPTAGLHFSRHLLDRLRKAGIERTELVLHVGPGTFRPVKVKDPREHRMESEEYLVPREAIDSVLATKVNGGRVVAVGTTAVRALETVAQAGKLVRGDGPVSGATGLFLYPPYKFRVVDALVTNFHLPRSTLLMLVSAFLGREHTLDAYRQAVAERYRFYSYGDAMLIL